MTAARRLLSEVLASLPPEWPEDLSPAIRAEFAAAGRKLVVLDDDPTGTQTVHDIPVLTVWDVPALTDELLDPAPACYILTNSRSLKVSEACALVKDVMQNLLRAAAATGKPIRVFSRSDSTLRGHFPEETDAIAEGLGTTADALLLVPCFFDGGRYTLDDVHYVLEGDQLVPAGETEFARDPAFGYKASDLRQWVVEKSRGRIPATQVRSLELEAIRGGGPDYVFQALSAGPRPSVWIVNAAAVSDLQVVALGMLRAERSGLRILCRTAASFVPVSCGMPPAPLLEPHDFPPELGAGLVVVGSFVPRTSRQLAALLEAGGLRSMEVSVAELLDGSRRDTLIRRAAAFATESLKGGYDTVLYTTRTLVTGSDREDSIALQRKISRGLCSIVRALETRPRFLVAKGGITASDLATEALGVKRALVLGQIYPGVPVWKLGPESRYPGIPYVVFPGNVGGDSTLLETVEKLKRAVRADRAGAERCGPVGPRCAKDR